MATAIRADISKRNRYYLDKHRYYELKHFCLQYPQWIRERAEISFVRASRPDRIYIPSTGLNRGSEDSAERLAWYDERIGMLERAAKEADPVIGIYILKGVVRDQSYDVLRANEPIPCCRDIYYELYRKFFYILSGLRQ